MKLVLVFLLALASVAHAQTPNQCPIPGQVLKRDYVGLRGETAKKAFHRTGSDEILTTAKLSSEIRTQVYKIFNETFCKQITETYQERVCQFVPMDIALGKGNQTFKTLFDFNITLLKRAELFAKSVSFFNAQTSAERLQFASSIVSFMGKYAATEGIPTSWEKVSAFMTKGVSEGHIPQAVADEVVTTYATTNKQNLGFVPLSGVEFSEGKGNGKLQKMINLQSTHEQRAQYIQTNLRGVSRAASMKLSISFVQFAAQYGIPQTWDQFVLMMNFSKDNSHISQSEYDMIVVSFEDLNRQGLGFERSARLCKMETRTRNVNILERREVKDFHEEVIKNFVVAIKDAPLLRDEKEEFVISFDGLSKLYFDGFSSYNGYTVTSYTEETEHTRIVVTGVRKLVTPPNKLHTQIIHDGNLLNLRIQNLGFNPRVGGRIIVKADFYEQVVLLPDTKIGSTTFELNGGDVTDIASRIAMKNPRRKARVDVSLQIIGSSYYSNKFSQTIETKE